MPHAQVSANALYGFTGAQTSMLQCLPLADSCLALGAASTRRAVEVIHELAADGARRALALPHFFSLGCLQGFLSRTCCGGPSLALDGASPRRPIITVGSVIALRTLEYRPPLHIIADH